MLASRNRNGHPDIGCTHPILRGCCLETAILRLEIGEFRPVIAKLHPVIRVLHPTIGNFCPGKARKLRDMGPNA